MILLIGILSILWAICISREIVPLEVFKDWVGLGKERKSFSEIPLIDFVLFCIHKLLNCSKCLSYWVFSISFMVIFGGGYGFLLGIIIYYITGWVQTYL